MGKLQLLRMTAYDENFSQSKGKPYVVMINPESIKWNRKIVYNDEQAPDTSTGSEKYKYTPSDELSFDIVIDCTGIVNPKRTDMAKEIKALEEIIFKYEGNIHRPNFVKIQWGKNITFKSVLKTFNTTYTLFKPDGSPLRAKISLSFGEYVSPKQRKKEDQRGSPDVSHLVSVVEGDTLPQLCQKVWDDSSMYIYVAKYNGLNKFRHLTGGDQLVFPPITEPTQ